MNDQQNDVKFAQAVVPVFSGCRIYSQWYSCSTEKNRAVNQNQCKTADRLLYTEGPSRCLRSISTTNVYHLYLN